MTIEQVKACETREEMVELLNKATKAQLAEMHKFQKASMKKADMVNAIADKVIAERECEQKIAEISAMSTAEKAEALNDKTNREVQAAVIEQCSDDELDLFVSAFDLSEGLIQESLEIYNTKRIAYQLVILNQLQLSDAKLSLGTSEQLRQLHTNERQAYWNMSEQKFEEYEEWQAKVRKYRKEWKELGTEEAREDYKKIRLVSFRKTQELSRLMTLENEANAKAQKARCTA